MAEASTPGVSEADYAAIKRATDTRREAVIIVLLGEAGLTTNEATQVRYADIHDPAPPTRATLLDVNDRTTFLPAAGYETISDYVETAELNATTPLIDISARRVQMLLSEVTTRAAATTGREQIASITGNDLRHRFAAHAIQERNVPLRIVRAAGGWETSGPLDAHLPSVEEHEILAAFTGDSVQTTTDLLDTTTRAVLSAAAPQTVAESVCTAVTNLPSYDWSWLVEHTTTGVLRTLAVAGINEAKLPTRVGDTADWVDAVRDGEVVVAYDPAFDGDIVAVPVAYGDTTIGTLVVNPTSSPSHGALDHQHRDRLALVGRQLAQAIAATRRRRLLESDAHAELEFAYDGDVAPLVRLARELAVPLDVRAVVPRGTDELLCYVDIETADPAAVADQTDTIDAIDEFRLVEQGEANALFEFGLTGTSLPSVVIDAGATVEALTVDGSVGQLVAAVPEGADIRAFVSSIRTVFPATEFVRKRTRDAPPTPTAEYTGIVDRMTDRQRAVLRAAFFGGYFDWPRGSTAEEIADSMDVSSPTFHRHLRQGLHTVLASLVAEDES